MNETVFGAIAVTSTNKMLGSSGVVTVKVSDIVATLGGIPSSFNAGRVTRHYGKLDKCTRQLIKIDIYVQYTHLHT